MFLTFLRSLLENLSRFSRISTELYTVRKPASDELGAPFSQVCALCKLARFRHTQFYRKFVTLPVIFSKCWLDIVDFCLFLLMLFKGQFRLIAILLPGRCVRFFRNRTAEQSNDFLQHKTKSFHLTIAEHKFEHYLKQGRSVTAIYMTQIIAKRSTMHKTVPQPIRHPSQSSFVLLRTGFL